MKDAQERLDRTQDALSKIRRGVSALIGQAEQAATEACEAQDGDLSADLWSIAASLKAADADLTDAWGKARRLNIGGIRPRFGGDGK
jgi:multidrug resistance efflux pump